MKKLLELEEIKELFTEVQKSSIFSDQKQMADAIPKLAVEEILEKYNISSEKLYETENFIQYLKMRCIRSVFKYTKDKVLCKTILNNISKKDIRKYYVPSSVRGYILKYIVLLPKRFSSFVLKTFKDKL